MNTKFLALALQTPLEQLLALPNAIRIAVLAKEELARFNDEQLHELLAWIDTAIQQAVAEEQSGLHSDVVTRDDQRDLDWLMWAHDHDVTHALRDSTPFGFRDYYRVLALYKLGTVIDAVCDLPVSALSLPVAFALMESLEAVLMAELMPDAEPLAQAIERTWAKGLTPPADVEHDVRQAKTQDARRAADIRHAANRKAKAEALQLYWSRQYRTIDEAARIISAAVCRSPMTVRNWIFEARSGE